MHRVVLSLLTIVPATAVTVKSPIPEGLPGVPATPGVSPVSKVVELLHDMQGNLHDEGTAEGKVWHDYTMWNSKEKVETQAKITSGVNSVADLKSFLSDQAAFQEDLKSGIAEQASTQAAKEAELTNVTETRNQEHKEFLAADEDRANALGQLALAIETLEAEGSSFLQKSYVEKLKLTALSQSSRVAAVLAQAGSKDDVIKICKDIQTETEDDKAKGMDDEQKARTDFETIETALKQEIKAATELKTSKSQELSTSEEECAAKTKELHETEEVLRLAEEYQENLRVEFNQKLAEHKEAMRIRSDEIMAVEQATQILTSEKAQSLFSGLAQIKTLATDGAQTPEAFVQVQMRSFSVERLAELNTLVERARQHGPFDKVKGMVRGMIDKLEKEHAAEASHHEFCQKEMGKTEESLKKKRAEVAKLDSRLQARQALREEAVMRMSEATAELSGIQSALSEAMKIRAEESSVNANAITDASNAITILKSAMQILTDVFAEKATAGNQIVGILEVAVSDYEKLHLEATTQETNAKAEFKKLESDTKVRSAALQTELDGLQHRKLNFQADEQDLSREKDAVSNEVAAAEQYMAELKPQCTTKVPTHEERATRRQAEIDGLNNALGALNGEALP
jgi:hypothetical protein